MRAREKLVGFRVPSHQKRALDREAAAAGVSLQVLIEHRLGKWLEELERKHAEDCPRDAPKPDSSGN